MAREYQQDGRFRQGTGQFEKCDAAFNFISKLLLTMLGLAFSASRIAVGDGKALTVGRQSGARCAAHIP